MRVAILAGEVRGHGRSKALLSTADALAQRHAVTIYPDAESWAFGRLTDWHGFAPDVAWRPDDEPDAPDLAIAWAKPLASRLSAYDCPTVAWVESGGPPAGADMVWCPSEAVAERTRRPDGPPAWTAYPTHYLRHLPAPTERERDIDVLLHDRKARDALDRLPADLNVVTTGDMDHGELIAAYERAVAFLHPSAPRFEPLGLMPIEAARYGCELYLTADSGAAGLYPDRAFDDPTAQLRADFST